MIGFIVFGLVSADWHGSSVPGRQHLGILMTLVLGVIGSVVGGVVANALGTGVVFELNFLGSIVAVATAVALIVLGDRIGVVARRSSE